MSMRSGYVEYARKFAVLHHWEQLYDNKPYVEGHLDLVAKIVEPWGVEAQVIAYLHDILEDTPVTEAELTNAFSMDVRLHVRFLSDSKEIPNIRSIRKLEWMERMSTMHPDLWLVGIVKTADRIANVQAGLKQGEAGKRYLATYRAEHKAFRLAIQKTRKGFDQKLMNVLDILIEE